MPLLLGYTAENKKNRPRDTTYKLPVFYWTIGERICLVVCVFCVGLHLLEEKMSNNETCKNLYKKLPAHEFSGETQDIMVTSHFLGTTRNKTRI